MTEETSKGSAAPYTSYQSIKTMLKAMQENGIPTRIDRSVLTNFSGAVGSQILTALKFLGMTSDDSKPTEQMRILVTAYGSDQWGAEVAKMLKKSYAPLFQLNLEAASPSQFLEKFKSSYTGTDDVQRKSITFFLNALRDTDIKISPYITRNKKPRSGPTKKRAPVARVKRLPGAKNPPPAPAGDYTPSNKSPSETLLSLMTPDMKQPEKDAIWTLIQHFKTKEANKVV